MIPDTPTEAQAPRVTHRPICYVFVCVGCDLLCDSTRRDQVFCSAACRQRAHRQPARYEHLRALAEQMDVSVAGILHAAAMQRLCPDLADAVMAGRRRLNTEARHQIYRAYVGVLVQAVER